MSLKAELEKWVKGLESFDAQDYAQALTHFEAIADSSKILFNMALINATMGNHKIAIAYYDQAHTLDQYLAVSFFQCGVSHFLLGQFEFAAEHFQNAYFHMRENQIIDYEQIGLKFRLYSAEILFNQGLAYINLNQQNQGMQLLDQARKEKQTNEHAVIDEAFSNYGRNYTVFSIPVGILFRPSELKVKNMKAKNYLGTAKLVAATEAVDAFIGFSGIGGRKASTLDDNKERDRAPSPPTTKARSPPSANLPLPPPPKDTSPVEGPVAPLRLSGRKSSVDLRGNAGGTSFPGVPALPPINTNVPRPSLDQRNQNQVSRYPMQGGLAGAVPPTPPDSDPGRQKNDLRTDRDRDSSGTALGYLGAGAPGDNRRDTEFMEELVDGYSAIDGPSLPRSALPPIPQGQSVERVADWANKQSRGPAQNRYLDPSGPLLGRSGTLNRYPTTRSATTSARPGMRKRSATQDEYRAPSAGSRDMEDIMSNRTNEMISFRLKLHFEDEIRGMSLDTDTPWSVFYARLQAKFGVADMNLKYKDEDGAFITIADEDDWDSAVDAAREHCPSGRQDGKLEVWVNESLDR